MKIVFFLIVLLIMTTVTQISFVNANPYFPPIRQLRAGASIETITCDTHLHVIVKMTSFMPACVKQDTLTKLVGRGWGITTGSFKSILNHALILTTDKKLYKIGETVKITITNTSNRSLLASGIDIVNSDKNTLVCCISTANIPPPLLSHNSLVWNWGQNNFTGGTSQVIVGNYTISESYGFENGYDGIKKTMSIEIK